MLIDLQSIWPRGLDEETWNATLFVPPVYRQPSVDQPDEFWSLAPAVGSTDGFQLLVLPPKRTPLVYTDTEELATLIASIAVDEDAWVPTSYAPTSFRQPVFDSDEDHAGLLGGLRVDEDYWTGNPYLAPSFRQPILDTDEDHAGALGGLRIDEDYWVGTPYLGPTFRQPATDTDDDHAGLLGGLRVDEVSWTPTPYVGPAFKQPVFDDEAIHSAVAPSLGVDDDLWVQPSKLVLPSSSLVIRDTDEEHAGLLGGLRVDEDYFVHGSYRSEPFRRPVSDTDENWFAALTINVDEEIWTRPYQQQLWTSTFRVQEPDENQCGSLGGFRLDDELWLDLRSRSATLFLQPSFVPDEWFIPVDEEIVHRVWQPQWQWPTPRVETYQDEFVVQPFGRDETYWIEPRQLQWPVSRRPVWTEDDVWVPSSPAHIVLHIVLSVLYADAPGMPLSATATAVAELTGESPSCTPQGSAAALARPSGSSASLSNLTGSA